MSHKFESKFPSSKRSDSKRLILTVDSRSRENPTYTTPSDYVIRFPGISQVSAATLLSAEVPNSQYVVNSTNNFIDFVDIGGGTGLHSVQVPPGTYAATDLADEINRVINLSLGFPVNFHFVITYLSSFQKMRFTRILGGNFSLLWASGPNASKSLGEKLGFNADILNVNTALSQQVVDLSGENFAFLVIDRFECIRNTENIKDVFAKIVWNVPPKTFCYDSFVANTVEFREPIPLLTNLHVRFIQQNGSLYDFNGLNHSFSIELHVNS